MSESKRLDLQIKFGTDFGVTIGSGGGDIPSASAPINFRFATLEDALAFHVRMAECLAEMVTQVPLSEWTHKFVEPVKDPMEVAERLGRDIGVESWRDRAIKEPLL